MKRFAIVLLIRHPSIDPLDISRELELEAYSSWKAGEPKRTLKGEALGGTRDRSSWNHVFEYKGGSPVFEEAQRLVSRLKQHSEFFAKLIQGGGYVELYFQLPGDVNQGSTAKPSLLKDLVDLEFHLGFEVFPDW